MHPFFEKLTEEERDSYQQFLGSKALSVVLRFVGSAMTNERNALTNDKLTLDEIRFKQGRHDGLATVVKFLGRSDKEFSPDTNREDK